MIKYKKYLIEYKIDKSYFYQFQIKMSFVCTSCDKIVILESITEIYSTDCCNKIYCSNCIEKMKDEFFWNTDWNSNNEIIVFHKNNCCSREELQGFNIHSYYKEICILCFTKENISQYKCEECKVATILCEKCSFATYSCIFCIRVKCINCDILSSNNYSCNKCQKNVCSSCIKEDKHTH